MLLTLHLNSLEQILTKLEQQPVWSQLRAYRQLLKCWHNTVNHKTAQHTRPLYVSRQVFWIATSSAARAQELSFQRYSLLKRLNQQLPVPLKDLRFTTSGWEQQTLTEAKSTSLFKISSSYKSPISSTSDQKLVTGSSPTDAAKKAAQNYLKTLTQSNSTQSNCPSCNAFTTKGELERWNLCYHCIAQQWSQEYRYPGFTKSR